MTYIIRLFLSLALVSSTCVGEILAPLEGPATGSEYFVGKELGKPLVTVNLLNGVNHPGVYHVPVQTTLPQLLAYAGGSLASADTSEIHVRRLQYDKEIFVRNDLNEIMNSSQPFPLMFDKDVVQIRERNNLDATIRIVTIVAGIGSTLLAAALIRQSVRNN